MSEGGVQATGGKLAATDRLAAEVSVGTRVHRPLDQLFALVLILLGLPAFLVIGLAILLVGGRPIIYGGERLGLRKRPFRMYKFRTLIREADRITGPRVIDSPGGLAIPLGEFLRDTRLDELPQLFNIARGDMVFVGPRPIRQAVYEAQCQDIENYDQRFSVKPGLIGISQLFTPSGTHKRFRALLDNQSLGRRPSQLLSLGIILFTAWQTARTAVSRILRYVRENLYESRLRGRHPMRRKRRRIRPRNARILVSGENGAATEGVIVDINDKAFRMECEQALPDTFPEHVSLEIECPNGSPPPAVRRAMCCAEVYQAREAEGKYTYVVLYRPNGARSYYVVHQYFLGESFAFSP